MFCVEFSDCQSHCRKHNLVLGISYLTLCTRTMSRWEMCARFLHDIIKAKEFQNLIIADSLQNAGTLGCFYVVVTTALEQWWGSWRQGSPHHIPAATQSAEKGFGGLWHAGRAAVELRENIKSCNTKQGLIIISHPISLWCTRDSDTRVIECRLVPRISPFLPSICIHNNQSSAPVIYCERKQKTKGKSRELGLRTRLHTVVVCR